MTNPTDAIRKRLEAAIPEQYGTNGDFLNHAPTDIKNLLDAFDIMREALEFILQPGYHYGERLDKARDALAAVEKLEKE